MSGATTLRAGAVPPPRHPIARAAVVVLATVVMVAAVLLLVRVEHGLRGAPKIPELQVLNRSALVIDVDVSGASRERWLNVATTGRHTVTTTRDIVDQGDVWYFRFRTPGVDGGELRVRRVDLEHDGWRIVVPDRLVEVLGREPAGAPGS